MNIFRFLYFIPTIITVAKSSAEADDGSLLAKSLFESKHMVRGSGSGSNDEKETGMKDEETSSINQRPKRMLEAGTKRLLQLISINDNEYEEIFTASDACVEDNFGASCSVSDDLVVIGAPFGYNERERAAYLFNLDGTEVAKLIAGDDGKVDDRFGYSVSIDEKVVVGSYGGFVRVFSRQGVYERTIRCDNCWDFGKRVATHRNLIVTKGYDYQNSIEKLYIYSTEGQPLESLEQVEYYIEDVAISEQFIVSTSLTYGKTIIYSNTSPDYPEIAEINQGGDAVAVSNDRLVIGKGYVNSFDGAAWLYKTDGTLVTALDRQDASSDSEFGHSVAITDDKVLVGAQWENNQGYWSGSVFIYSADTGEFIKKVLAPDARCTSYFYSSVCASDSHYVVGSPCIDYFTGAAYLFNIPS